MPEFKGTDAEGKEIILRLSNDEVKSAYGACDRHGKEAIYLAKGKGKRAGVQMHFEAANIQNMVNRGNFDFALIVKASDLKAQLPKQNTNQSK